MKIVRIIVMGFLILLIHGCRNTNALQNNSIHTVDSAKSRSRYIFIALTEYFYKYNKYPETLNELKDVYINSDFLFLIDDGDGLFYTVSDNRELVILTFAIDYYECTYVLKEGIYIPSKDWRCEDKTNFEL